MIAVKLIDRNPNDVLDIVKELRAQGLVQGTDFDFSYHQARYDNDGWTAVENKHAVFMFHTEKYATLFILKYAS